MAKERPVNTGGKSANPRGRHPATPPAPGPRPAADNAADNAVKDPTDPRPIAPPFLVQPVPASSEKPIAQPGDPAEQAEPEKSKPKNSEPDKAEPDKALPHKALPQDEKASEPAVAGKAQQVNRDLNDTNAKKAWPPLPPRGPVNGRPDSATARGRASAPAAALDREKGHGNAPGRIQATAPVSPAQPTKIHQRGVAKVPARPAPLPQTPGLQLQPVVHVADMPAAVDFYEALGGALIHGDRDGAWVLMQVGTNQLSLVSRLPDPSRGEGAVELNFSATMPLDRLQQLLIERNITIVEVAGDAEVGTRLHVETPDGMPVKIHHVEPDFLV